MQGFEDAWSEYLIVCPLKL